VCLCVCVEGGCNIINFYLSFYDFSNEFMKHANGSCKGQIYGVSKQERKFKLRAFSSPTTQQSLGGHLSDIVFHD
jgi:hypothetical protein